MTPTPLWLVVLRVGAVLVAVAGLVGVGLAIRYPGTGSGAATAVPLQPAATATLPDPGLFRRGVTLYGRPPTPGEKPPTAADLGCVLLDRAGHPTAAARLDDLVWVRRHPQTVAGRRLTALLGIGGYGSGWTLTCSGPAASSHAPLYLLTGGVSAGLQRVVIGCFGVLLAAVGLIASVALGLVARHTGSPA